MELLQDVDTDLGYAIIVMTDHAPEPFEGNFMCCFEQGAIYACFQVKASIGG